MAHSLLFSLFSLVLIFPIIKTNSVNFNIEIGSETDSGSWPKFYEILYPMSIDEHQYVFAQCTYDNTLFIRELLPNGRMGIETEKTTWSRYYEIQFPFSIDGRHFIYGHTQYNGTSHQCRWFIQEVLPSGRLGSETDSGSWGRFYDTNIPFSINGRQFFYAQAKLGDKNWFIQELLPGGKIGSETSSGKWQRYYSVQFPFTINGRHFIYGHTDSENHWFIQEILPGGIMGSETDHGNYNNYYPTQFPFSVNGSQFFYGRRSPAFSGWFMQSLLPGGKSGIELYRGSSRSFYSFAYSVGGKTFLFTHFETRSDSPNWNIQEVIATEVITTGDGVLNSAGSESKDMLGASSLGDSKWTSTVAPDIPVTATHTP